MTLSEFAYLLDVDPKWVQNTNAALGGTLEYTLPTAKRLAVTKAISDSFRIPLKEAYELAGQALNQFDGSATPVHLPRDEQPVELVVDVYRILAAVNIGLSRLATMYDPPRRGRPPVRNSDPITAAREYGLDITLFGSTLRRTITQRLEQLEGMFDFNREVRRAYPVPTLHRTYT